MDVGGRADEEEGASVMLGRGDDSVAKVAARCIPTAYTRHARGARADCTRHARRMRRCSFAGDESVWPEAEEAERLLEHDELWQLDAAERAQLCLLLVHQKHEARGTADRGCSPE